MTNPEPAVHIGLTSIYHEVMAIKSQLGPMACDLKALRQSTRGELDDHEVRIRVTEGGRMPWGVIGGLTALSALAVAIVALFLK